MPLAGWCVDPKLENIKVHIILLVCCNDCMSFSGYRGGIGRVVPHTVRRLPPRRAGAAGPLLLVVYCRW